MAVDELHRDEDAALEGADVVDHDHVGVRDLGDRLRLAHQARAPRVAGVGVVAAGAQQLDRDLAIQLGIVRGVDLAHGAPAHEPEDDEAIDLGPARERLARRAASFSIFPDGHTRGQSSHRRLADHC